MGRRGHNEGSIYQRESDGRWVSCVHLGYEDGKRKRHYIYGATRREVADKLKRFEAEHVECQPVSPERQTVGQFLDRWLTDVVKPKNAPRTFESYADEVRRHIKPALGHLRLKRLSPQDVQAFLRRKEEQGLSPRTVQYLRAILRIALNQALRWGEVARNAAALAQPPRVERHERPFLTPEDAARLLEVAKGDRLEALWVVALSLGLRRGEALGLKWEDVDLQAGTLRVEQALKRAGGRLVLGPLKTSRSRRTLPLPGVTADALREHRRRQLQERLFAGDRWQDDGFVFASAVGTALDLNNASNRFKALVRRAELPETIRLHDCRHACASFLIAQGVDARMIMEILGHADIGTTMNLYGHVFPAAKREVADLMDRALGRREVG